MFYQCKTMPQGDTDKNDKFIMQNGRKVHQRSNMQWHYIKKYMSQGVQFTWKVSYLFHKVHNFRTTPLY